MSAFAGRVATVSPVSVLVVIPNKGTWKVSGAAFRLLAREATKHLQTTEDREVLVWGQALNGLFLDKLDPEQALRLAVAMRGAVETLRTGLLGSATEWDQSFADSLGDLALRLTELARSEDA
jgi:hypothetical protein